MPKFVTDTDCSNKSDLKEDTSFEECHLHCFENYSKKCALFLWGNLNGPVHKKCWLILGNDCVE